MPGHEPRVSVVLPVYNRAHLLERSLGSILAQTYRDFQVIVVDDASTDNTSEVVEQFRDPRVRYLRHQNNKGAPGSRNTGIMNAKGEFVAFQDSDDEWKPDKLAKQMARFDADPRLTVVYSGVLRHDDDRLTYIPDRHIKKREGDISHALLRENFVSTVTLIVRRRGLLEVGGFVEDLPRFQDWELAIRLSQAYSFGLVDEPLVDVYPTPGNITSDGPAGILALEKILGRHYDVISGDPEALARFFFKIGFFRGLYQHGENARPYLVKAVKTAPWRPYVWLGLLLSYLGPRALALAWHFRRSLKISRHSGYFSIG
jgi:glycosyltransferase involved in cell wall biosynthesis